MIVTRGLGLDTDVLGALAAAGYTIQDLGQVGSGACDGAAGGTLGSGAYTSPATSARPSTTGRVSKIIRLRRRGLPARFWPDEPLSREVHRAIAATAHGAAGRAEGRGRVLLRVYSGRGQAIAASPASIGAGDMWDTELEEMLYTLAAAA